MYHVFVDLGNSSNFYLPRCYICVNCCLVSAPVPETTIEAASIRLNTMGLVVGIGASILFVGAILIVTIILWRY